MFGVIRAAGDYSVIVLVTPPNSKPNDPSSRYFLYNRTLLDNDDAQERLADAGNTDVVLREVPEITALRYFSGIADGLGFGELPESSFASLADAWRWIREAQQKASAEMMQRILRCATSDIRLLDILVKHFGKDEMIRQLERSSLSAEEKQRILERYSE